MHMTTKEWAKHLKRQFDSKLKERVMTIRVHAKVQHYLMESAYARAHFGIMGEAADIYRKAIEHFLDNTEDVAEAIKEMAFSRIIVGDKTNISLRLPVDLAEKVEKFKADNPKYDINISDIANEAFFRYCSILDKETIAFKKDPSLALSPPLREAWLEADKRQKEEALAGL
jgi:hypothetical protein